ncbi:hypothetical protein KP509_32G054300 [Ceratopteris richardii]|uniref:Reverse transcriptase zinc-binding domain-containing protein n=1 Tax=Ceratopteris richardii TaxID=49495 RepID=A0A8T2QV31_CERRI|nr:hypothetical protein KP509_32G054300 [Ceratopteris richardii]
MDEWYALQWPLHARIRIVQAFLQPYIMYYLLLLDWKKIHIRIFDSLLKNFLWSKKHNRALVLSAWEYICQPKSACGLGILHLHSHLMARREAFIMRITFSHRPLWAHIFWKCIENAEVNFKGKWKLDVWNKFFSHAPLKTSSQTRDFLLWHFKSTVSTLKWNGRQCYIGNSLAALSPYRSFLSNPPIAYSLGVAARYLNNKGMDPIAKYYDSKWELLSFPVIRKTYAVGSMYRSEWLEMVLFLQQYQMPLSIDASDPWRDWLLAKHTRWWIGKANIYNYSLIAPDSIAHQCNQRWKLKKSASWWHVRFRMIWESSLTFKMKVFVQDFCWTLHLRGISF